MERGLPHQRRVQWSNWGRNPNYSTSIRLWMESEFRISLRSIAACSLGVISRYIRLQISEHSPDVPYHTAPLRNVGKGSGPASQSSGSMVFCTNRTHSLVPFSPCSSIPSTAPDYYPGSTRLPIRNSPTTTRYDSYGLCYDCHAHSSDSQVS